MFSATMPNAVEKIARKYLRCPSYITIGEPGAGKKDIEQRVEIMGEQEKKNRLKKILEKAEPPIIIFLNEKKAVEYLAKIIDNWGWRAVIYHGGKTQEQREAAVESFKARKYDILVCTDLAGRGLDVEGVQYVINFDAPKNISDFIHRTGRTGRAGKKGVAYTFLTSKNEDLFYDLKNFLAQNGHSLPEELANHPASKIKPGSIENVPRRKQIIYAQ
jgi:ATP-dependent RNA helicase DDX23/PRP28